MNGCRSYASHVPALHAITTPQMPLVQEGNYRTSWETYTEVLKMGVHPSLALKVYSNRSLAFSKALRHSEALSDADRHTPVLPLPFYP